MFECDPEKVWESVHHYYFGHSLEILGKGVEGVCNLVALPLVHDALSVQLFAELFHFVDVVRLQPRSFDQILADSVQLLSGLAEPISLLAGSGCLLQCLLEHLVPWHLAWHNLPLNIFRHLRCPTVIHLQGA